MRYVYPFSLHEIIKSQAYEISKTEWIYCFSYLIEYEVEKHTLF